MKRGDRMKKLSAILISCCIIISSIIICAPAFAETYETKRMEAFADECIEIANEYDEGKEFQVVEAEASENDDLQFQTGRLFVKCASSFNKMGAEETVSGFSSWHLLQFATPQEAKRAYEYYLTQDNIECVEPDVPIKTDLCASKSIHYIDKEAFYNDYSRKVMGFNELIPYIESHQISAKKVRVAVLDSNT